MTPTARLRVGIVGAGAVAAALARALGTTCDVRIWARRRDAAQGIVGECSAESEGAQVSAALTLPELCHVEVILIAVSDHSIVEVAERLRGAGDASDLVVLHTSGRWSGAQVLAPIADVASVGSLHPLVAVARDGGGSFRGMPFAVEAEDAVARDFAALIVRRLGGEVIALPPGAETKLRYHALATMVATGVVTLVDQAAHALTPDDAEAAEALRRAYGRLALSAARNIVRAAGPDVLTGALARDDEATVAAHREALERTPEGELYRAVEGGARRMLARPRATPEAEDPKGDTFSRGGDSMDHGPLVVSLVAPSMDALAAALASGAAEGADLVELRLDQVAATCRERPSALRELIGRIDVPVIVAVHGDEGFGSYSGPSHERAGLLRVAAECGAAFIDVDERFASELGDVPARRVLSTHADLDARADFERTAARLDALAGPGDLVKIVPHGRSVEQAFELMHWLASRPQGSTIAFASGDVGAFTRFLAPAYGSALVYAAPATDVEGDLEPAAPGQWPVPHVRAVWPMVRRAPSRGTRIAAVVGQPIAHSAGPVVHGAALRAAGLDAMLVPIAPERLAEVPFVGPSGQLEPSGAGRPGWGGLSVTAPFKLDVLTYASPADGITAAIGASNTLARNDAGRLVASNTDAPAVRVAFEDAGAELAGADALVIGAGGAARAAVAALTSAGARVTVAARRVEAATELCRIPVPGGTPDPIPVALGSEAFDALRPAVIVHTTPLGTDGVGDVPIRDEQLAGAHVLDAVYRPRRTALLDRTARAGGVPIEGSRWFLEQAWLQHRTLFDADYLAQFGFGGPPGEVVDAARAAMADALELWLSGAVGKVRP